MVFNEGVEYLREEEHRLPKLISRIQKALDLVLKDQDSDRLEGFHCFLQTGGCARVNAEHEEIGRFLRVFREELRFATGNPWP